MASFKIVMVRHGQSEWNEKNLLCGWYDAKLTKKGEQQARNAGKALKNAGFKFDIAYTSVLIRAQNTLQLILEEIRQTDVKVVQTWRLNERHFGSLTGLNKIEITAKYGEEQVNKWRRSFDISLPPMEPDHAYYENVVKDSSDVNGPAQDQSPKSETLKTAIERTLVFWNDTIVPQIKAGKKIIISGHENTLRGLIKHLEQMSDEQFKIVDLLNGVPFVYTLDENLRPTKALEFVGDPESVRKAKEAMGSNHKVNNILK